MTLSAANTPESRSTDFLTDLQRSVLLTVLYADLFDFALTEDELRRRLVFREAEPDALKRCVASLTDVYLTTSAGYTVWQGREHLVELRRRRARASTELWPIARRYARWLSRVPFVRMVAVSGSLAAANADSHSDVDLFCITDDRRLWLARLFIVACSKATRLLASFFPRYLCPNYILARSALEIRDQNLFTAHEVAQAVPLYGEDEHRAFLESNVWIRSYLPTSQHEGATSSDPRKPGYSILLERLLAGRPGDTLDGIVYRVFRTFYRRRALRRGWSWTRLESAYERSRYTVPEQGYIPVVRRLFEQRVEARLGRAFVAAGGERLFPDNAAGAEPAQQSRVDPPDSSARCCDWEAQFLRDYGVSSADHSHPASAGFGGRA